MKERLPRLILLGMLSLVFFIFLFVDLSKKEERIDFKSKKKSLPRKIKKQKRKISPSEVRILEGKNIPPLKEEKRKLLYGEIKQSVSKFLPRVSFYEMFDEEIEHILQTQRDKIQTDNKDQNLVPSLDFLKELKKKRALIY